MFPNGHFIVILNGSFYGIIKFKQMVFVPFVNTSPSPLPPLRLGWGKGGERLIAKIISSDCFIKRYLAILRSKTAGINHTPRLTDVLFRVQVMVIGSSGSNLHRGWYSYLIKVSFFLKVGRLYSYRMVNNRSCI